MSFSRRTFLKLGGATAVAASATACSTVARQVAQRELPPALPAAQQAPAPVVRLLHRAGYGPRPGDLERATRMGLDVYLEEQLAPHSIEDTAADLLIRNLTLYHMDVDQLRNQEERDAVRELLWATTARALYSKRQLYEAMVEFWSDHFNIYLRKNEFMPFLKLVDDRDVIRPHALGNFRDLLAASVRSPAMLVYLDNVQNHREQLNENYGRELLELHTLGVDGGYTQQDVQELARLLTGLGVQRRGRRSGHFLFRPELHDDGAKVILGHTFPAGGGPAEVDAVIDLLASHPATADFLATKLVRRFVADEPPPALVAAVAQSYRDSGGEIRAMLRVIFRSEAFATAPPKLKRPFTYMISALRAVGADVGRSRPLGDWMRRLGQPLFHWPPPDGYPDTAAAWASNLLPRWNFALALVNDEIPRVRAPLARLVNAGQAQNTEEILQLFARLLLGRPLTPPEMTRFADYVGSGAPGEAGTRHSLREAVALLLAGPAFQWT